jgi:hypothetical protein
MGHISVAEGSNEGDSLRLANGCEVVLIGRHIRCRMSRIDLTTGRRAHAVIVYSARKMFTHYFKKICENNRSLFRYVKRIP